MELLLERQAEVHLASESRLGQEAFSEAPSLVVGSFFLWCCLMAKRMVVPVIPQLCHTCVSGSDQVAYGGGFKGLKVALDVSFYTLQ